MHPRNRETFSPRAVAAYRAGPVGTGIAMKAATADAPAEMLIYDTIGADPWSGGGVSATDVVAALAKVGAGSPVTVRINSPGGDVWDGMAIYNALASHKGGVSVVVDGIAASAASFIAMAGTVAMHESSTMMIHNARTVTYGQASDMQETAALLARVDGQIAAIYEAKSGQPAVAMMAAETWMTAAEAKTAGLCDTVIPMTRQTPPKAEAEPVVEPPAPAIDRQRMKNILALALAAG